LKLRRLKAHLSAPSSITTEALRTEVETIIGQSAATLSDEVNEDIDNAVGELYVPVFPFIE
jgi:hypothetical protein